MQGLGNDIVEIDRLRKAFAEHGQPFLDKLFTVKEQEYCQKQKDPFERFAGRFAAKEAVVKALGTGFGGEIGWHDIEILPDEQGRPIVSLAPKVTERLGHPQILVSISHTKTLATAVACFQKKYEGNATHKNME